MNSAVLVILGVCTLTLRAGMILHQSGMLRAKNAAGSLMRALADTCAAVLAFWLIGAGFIFSSGNPVIGFNLKLIAGVPSSWEAAEIFRTLAAVLLGVGIVSGAVAERSRFFVMVIVAAVVAGFIIPIAGYWVWSPTGWLRPDGKLGYIDFAGGSAIHLVGGIAAAVAAGFIGPRQGKYNRDGSCNAIPGHSVTQSSAGVVVMFAMWVPYVASFDPDKAGSVAMNVILAAAAGGLASLALCHWRYGKPDIHLTYVGILSALVAVSAPGPHIGCRAAVALGIVAGLVGPMLTLAVDLLWRIDDPSGAVAIHGGGGLVGALAAGFLARTSSIGARFVGLGVQIIGVLAIAALALGLSVALFMVLRAVMRLRASEADEFDGLDLAEHDINAYPDFQQTMIKSYHLREA